MTWSNTYHHDNDGDEGEAVVLLAVQDSVRRSHFHDKNGSLGSHNVKESLDQCIFLNALFLNKVNYFMVYMLIFSGGGGGMRSCATVVIPGQYIVL